MQEPLSDEQVASLRVTWNAPKRHVLTTPKFEGAWNEKLEQLKTIIKPGRGVIVALTGGRGNGKTQMAVEVMRLMTQNGWTCLFTTSVELFVEFKESFKKETGVTELEILKAYRRPRLLVIDEFGKSSDGPWLNTLLFEILNARYNDMKDTILIDNRSKEEFELAVGSSIASRINEGGGIIECKWETYRK